MKNNRPKIDIRKLREIGWSLWDPIGLKGAAGDWQGKPFEDEYDTYLIKAAGMLRSRCDIEEVFDYLLDVETNRMGLGFSKDGVNSRAHVLKVVKAISEEPKIWSDC